MIVLSQVKGLFVKASIVTNVLSLSSLFMISVQGYEWWVGVGWLPGGRVDFDSNVGGWWLVLSPFCAPHTQIMVSKRQRRSSLGIEL